MSVEVKKEPGWVSEARAALYEGHVVKNELVLGPVVLQQPDSVYNLNDLNSLPAVKEKATDADKTVTSRVTVKKEPKWETEDRITQESKWEGMLHVDSNAMTIQTHVDKAVKRELLKYEDDCKINGIYEGFCLQEDTQGAGPSHPSKPDSTPDGQITDKLQQSHYIKSEPKRSRRLRIQYETDAELETSRKSTAANPKSAAMTGFLLPLPACHGTDTEFKETSHHASRKSTAGQPPKSATITPPASGLTLPHQSYQPSLGGILKPKIYECNYCGKKFAVKPGLINHIRIHTGEKPYSCNICLKRFSDCAVLIRHRRMHAGLKPYDCNICGKKYSEKYLLKNHKLTHTGQMQYFCKLCPKTFVNSSNFRRHQRVHLHKYICDICKRHFKKKNTLLFHVINHMKPKKFVCKLCEKGFVQNGHLNRHMGTHTGQEKHACGGCGKAFNQKQSLTKHVRRKVCEKKGNKGSF